MIRLALGMAAATLCYTSVVAAEPCVGTTFDVPLQNAVGVVTLHADVPSPQFPGVWQEGTIKGFSYALYANGEAVLKSGGRISDWEYKITCEAGDADCTQVILGAPPAETQILADNLGECLQGKPLSEPEPVVETEPDVEPEAIAAPEVATEPAAVEAEAPCGVAAVEEGSEGEVLQRLLVAAGEDPGPIDGFVGKGTRKALGRAIGSTLRWSPVPEAIEALDKLLCE